MIVPCQISQRGNATERNGENLAGNEANECTRTRMHKAKEMLFAFVGALVLWISCSPCSAAPSFTIDRERDTFLKDGQPFRLAMMSILPRFATHVLHELRYSLNLIPLSYC